MSADGWCAGIIEDGALRAILALKIATGAVGQAFAAVRKDLHATWNAIAHLADVAGEVYISAKAKPISGFGGASWRTAFWNRSENSG